MPKLFSTRIRAHGDSAGEENDPLIRSSGDEYKALEEGDGRVGSVSSWKLKSPTHTATWTGWKCTVAIMAILVMVFAALMLWTGSAKCAFVRPITPKLDVPASIQQTWAQYSPYFAADRYPAVPSHCEIDQVSRNIIIALVIIRDFY